MQLCIVERFVNYPRPAEQDIGQMLQSGWLIRPA